MESLIGDKRRIKVCSLENNSWALLLKSEMDIYDGCVAVYSRGKVLGICFGG
jgi:hypothetical protein